MKKSIAMVWIKRLRNPNMRQARGSLKDGRGMCCLGHLCVVMGEKFDKNGHCLGSAQVLPDELVKKAEMRSPSGRIGNNKLSAMNDEGMSLRTIADVIEKHWRQL